MNYKTCCFTGHRPAKFSFRHNEESQECITLKGKLHQEILNMIMYNKVRHFITGMAQGVDQWAAEIILELKELYPDITLHAAVPFPAQAEKWRRLHKERYDYILDLCDEVNIISPDHTSTCMLKRNHYMVDNSDYLIAVWNGSFSCGTGKTIKYASQLEKTIVVIDC